MEKIKGQVAGQSWNDAGGPGQMVFDKASGYLVVLQPQPIQVKVQLAEQARGGSCAAAGGSEIIIAFRSAKAAPLSRSERRLYDAQPKYSGSFPGFHLMLQPRLGRCSLETGRPSPSSLPPIGHIDRRVVRAMPCCTRRPRSFAVRLRTRVLRARL